MRVLLTRNTGKPDAETVVVLDRVRIYSVGYDERSIAISSTANDRGDAGPLASLTLIVTAEQARVLASAKHGGDLDVALLPSLPVSAATPAASPTVVGP